ncbi:hypothetical protein R69746_04107 [Paraburkholderia aspalathi]|nr:hypothetical protein R69746_04107 [Paraburkholderia aspalathi]
MQCAERARGIGREHRERLLQLREQTPHGRAVEALRLRGERQRQFIARYRDQAQREMIAAIVRMTVRTGGEPLDREAMHERRAQRYIERIVLEYEDALEQGFARGAGDLALQLRERRLCEFLQREIARLQCRQPGVHGHRRRQFNRQRQGIDEQAHRVAGARPAVAAARHGDAERDLAPVRVTRQQPCPRALDQRVQRDTGSAGELFGLRR